MSKPVSLPRRLAAEGIGTAFLLMAVIGSGIMGERLAAGNNALALLANSTATGCILAVLILIFAPVSGAHFNPAVTLCMALQRKISGRDALAYSGVQVVAALLGVAAAHLMFGEPPFFVSEKIRAGGSQWWSEFVATFGMLMVIWACAKQSLSGTPLAVAAYIAGAYWFTSSTSFANPAVTIARAFSNTFAGIRPEDVLPFLLAQMAGALCATLFCRWIFTVR
ncbi:MAG: aquaporin family protein [Alphaproteobacteria bacterium]|nr:MAG: aquaporin family protein [Alphaproteobacteria bacterium]